MGRSRFRVLAALGAIFFLLLPTSLWGGPLSFFTAKKPICDVALELVPQRDSRVGASKSSSAGEAEKTLEEHIAEVNGIDYLKTIRDRDLPGYLTAFPALARRLARIARAGGHWIDLGAGLGNAAREFIRDPQAGFAKVTCVTVENPPEWYQEGKEPVKWVTGKKLGEPDFPFEQMEKADVITDFVGAFSYTLKLDHALQQSLSMLKPGGTLDIIMFENTKIKTKHGEISFGEWVKTIPGLDVVHEGSEIQIRVTPGSRIVIPKLRVSSTKLGSPPDRTFEVVYR